MSIRSANRGAAVVVAVILAVTPVLQALPQTPAPAKPAARQARTAKRPGQGRSRRARRRPDRRLAAHLHHAEPGPRDRLRAADRELGEPEAAGRRSRRRRIRPRARPRRPSRRSAPSSSKPTRSVSLERAAGQFRQPADHRSRISRRCPKSSCARSSPRSRRRFPKTIASSRSIACWRSSTRAPSCRRTCPGSRPIRR